MIAILLAFLATVAVGAIAIHRVESDVDATSQRRVASNLHVIAALAALVAAYGAQLALLRDAALTQRPFPSWFALLPFVTIDDRAPYFGHAPIGGAVALCTLLETAALTWFYYSARRATLDAVARTAIGVTAAAMIVAAFVIPVTTSFDMYAYVGAAHVPNAYRPPRQAFDGALFALNRIYGVPIFPTPYGPIWIAFCRVLLGPIASLAAQLFVLRLVETAALLASALALRRLRFDLATVALVLLNPALVNAYVLDGHNDLVPIALVLWGIALAERNAPLAMALGILAGNVKLPFIFISSLIFAHEENGRRRFTLAASVVAGGIALSAIFGGSDYAYALRATSALYRAFADPATNAIHVALGFAAVACVALAIAARAYVPSGAWAFAGTAATFFGWYVPWGLPYAVRERGWLGAFLISLPFATFFLATIYGPSSIVGWALRVAIVAAPLAVYFALRRRSTPARTSLA